ncbi:M23 family metallopeptidase, partial [bacterium]|nr:M23 family metallopeptidase [bacterium]
ALPVAAPPGKATLKIAATFGGAEGRATDAETLSGADAVSAELSAPFAIEAKSFVREDIPLDKANTQLRTEPDPAKTAESLAFAKIFQERDPTALFALGPMTKPLTVAWRETATFADERRYLYYGGGVDSIRHGGIDIGAKEGSPVLACAPGRVVFAGPRIVTGNTIVLEHLPGLFSLYMHLSAIAAREGEVVAQGQKIGLVGSTGLSTGPHLHWELRVGETSVNPAYWLARPLLDKSGPTGKIEAPAKGR